MRVAPKFFADEINIKWHIDDIKNVDDSLTDDQCREILASLKRKFDASIGINWEVIEAAIFYYKHDNNLE